jgi:hypothetical protein
MTTKKLGESLRYFSPVMSPRGPHEAFAATATEPAKPLATTAFVSSPGGMNFCVFLSQAPPIGLDAESMHDYREGGTRLLRVAGLVSAHVREKAEAHGGVFASTLWQQTLQHVPLWSCVSENSKTTSGAPPAAAAFTDGVGKAFIGFLASEEVSAENDLPRRLWSAISSQWPQRDSPERGDFTFNLLLLTMRITQGANNVTSSAFGLFSATKATNGMSIETSAMFGPWVYGGATEGTRRAIDDMLGNVPVDRVAEGGNYLNYSFDD